MGVRIGDPVKGESERPQHDGFHLRDALVPLLVDRSELVELLREACGADVLSLARCLPLVDRTLQADHIGRGPDQSRDFHFPCFWIVVIVIVVVVVVVVVVIIPTPSLLVTPRQSGQHEPPRVNPGVLLDDLLEALGLVLDLGGQERAGHGGAPDVVLGKRCRVVEPVQESAGRGAGRWPERQAGAGFADHRYSVQPVQPLGVGVDPSESSGGGPIGVVQEDADRAVQPGPLAAAVVVVVVGSGSCSHIG